jgi:hypothetical protein
MKTLTPEQVIRLHDKIIDATGGAAGVPIDSKKAPRCAERS